MACSWRISLLLLLLLGLTLDRTQAQSTRPLIRIDLQSLSSALSDQTHVYFQAGATTGFDSSFDATKLANPSGLNVATIMGGQQYAINGLPPYSPGVPLSVPLFVGVPVYGNYRFQVGQLDNFASARVYLRDLGLNTRTPLSLGTQYQFNMNGTFSTSTRFVLEFEPLPDLVVSTNMTNPLDAYNNVTITSTGYLLLVSDLNVAGTLTVQAGGHLATSRIVLPSTIAQNILTGNSFVMEPGSHLLVGSPLGISSSGATGSIQTTTRSFSPEGHYTYGSAHPVGGSAVTGSGLPATVRSLGAGTYEGTPGSLAAGTLRLSQPLTITEQLDLYFNLNTNGQALTLHSTPTGGTAIVGAISGTLTGGLTVERAIDPSLNPGAGYRHFSNPLNSGTTFTLNAGPSFVPISNPAYNSSATPGTVVPFPNLFTYDFTAIAGSPALGYSPFDRGWRALSPGSPALARGNGFIAHLGANNLVRFTGTLNESNQSVAVPANPGGLPGWVLLGNPFAAPIDGRLITRPASVPPAFYVFETTGQYAGRYRSYVNGVGSSPLIPVGQGFFMSQAPGGAAASIDFPTSSRVTPYDAATPTLHRNGPDLRPLVKLQLSGNGSSDELYVYSEAGATPTYDAQYDAYKLPSPGQVELAALAGNEALSITGLPVLNPAQAMLVPLRLSLPRAGSYVLEAATLANLTGVDAYLLDASTGTRVNLRQQPRYSFSAATGSLAGRFTLQLGAAQLTNSTNAALAAVALYPNPTHATVTVTVPAVSNAKAVVAVAYNTLGQAMLRQEGSATPAGTTLTLDTSRLAPGVYTLRLTAGTGIVTKRLVVE
jgi:hypothetical protein